MRQYLEGGANAYFMWNMVLDETGNSTWDWRQNSMVSVDRDAGTYTFNGEFYVMKHFSHYVQPGAKRVRMTGWWGDPIGFVNPDGSRVLVIGNSSGQAWDVRIQVADEGDNTIRASLSPASINTSLID